MRKLEGSIHSGDEWCVIVKSGSGNVDYSSGWFNFRCVYNRTGDGDLFFWLVLLSIFGAWMPLAV